MFGVIAVLAALVYAGCSSEAPELKVDNSRVLERAVGSEPESLDPHLAKTSQAQIVQRDLFEGLVAYSPDGEVVPGVALSWDISDDGLTYTFTLRDNARWSNGDPVTAEDFVFSLRRLVDPATASFYAETLSVIENTSAIVQGTMPPSALGVAAPDDGTLVITLERRAPYLLSLLTHPAAMPVNEDNIRQHGEAFARPGNLVSNGAYKLEKWELGSVIEISRNEQYWDNGGTAISRVRHHVTPEPASELSRYRADEIDITSTVPGPAYQQLVQNRPDELRIAPTLAVYFIGINVKDPVLGGSRELREALSMAIDREAIVEQVVGRGEAPAYSFVPPGVANYQAPSLSFQMLSPTARLERAEQLLRDAGYGPDNPPEIELRYNTSASHKAVMSAVADMWKKAFDFEVTLINEEFRVLVSNIQAKEITQLFRLRWDGDYNDPHAFLYLFESGNASNMFNYESDDFDRYLKQAGDAGDPARRRSYNEEAERELLNDHVVIPIYFPVSKHLVSPDIGGWEDNVIDYHYSKDLEFLPANR